MRSKPAPQRPPPPAIARKKRTPAWPPSAITLPPLPSPKRQPGGAGEVDPREDYVAHDIAEILNAMQQGVTYAVGDLQGILPAGHPLAQGSPEACRARLGKLMEKARGYKFVERVRDPRRSLYRLLPQAGIIGILRQN